MSEKIVDLVNRESLLIDKIKNTSRVSDSVNEHLSEVVRLK